jgi:integrase
MPTFKLTKKAVDNAAPQENDYELRDTEAPGFLCKVTKAGRKVFMLQYRTIGGERRKPSIGLFGELTVDQARTIAHKWLADVRSGKDPSLEKQRARTNPTIRELCAEFIERHSIPHNKPSTVKGNRSVIRKHAVPALGKFKVAEITRADISRAISDRAHIPCAANHLLSMLKKMFNCAELWGYRADGTNPCRLIPKYPDGKRTRLIKNPELARLYAYLDRADSEGLEHPTYTLAVRLQFAFAARMSEIINLEWEWIDFEERRIIWPDSKNGEMSKPLSEEAYDLLWNAPRFAGSPYVVPAITKPSRPMSKHSYWEAWKRILAACGVAHLGTHGIRHRAATDIANSGIPLKVGMTLTAHKTVTMFMRYVHVEDDQVRAAAEIVADRRAAIVRAKGALSGAALPKPFDTLPAGGKVVRRDPASMRGHLSRRAANDR